MQIALLFFFNIFTSEQVINMKLHQTGNKKIKKVCKLFWLQLNTVHYPLILTTSHLQYRSFTEYH